MAATGYTSGDPAKVNRSGDTMTGALVVSATGATGGYPLGIPGAVDTGVNVRSSFAGGEDNGSGTDSTGRLNLYSYQRADVGSFGENIRRFLMRANAKSMDAWYLPRTNGQMTPGYDGSGNPLPDARWVPVAWIGAHWRANDGLSIHGHWSVEVPDTTGAVQTRFEIPFTDQEAVDASKLLGVDVTNIRTNLADLTVRANLGVHGEGKLRVGGGNSVNKDLLLSISADRATSGRRWAVRANTTTEAGSNSGTDFQVLAYSDAGAELAARLHISRATGNVGVGTTTVTAARLTAAWGTSGVHGFLAQPTADPGAGAAYAAILPLATSRTEDSRVTGDGIARMVRYADGKHEWGDGTNARDTNLYRKAANQLGTDDAVFLANQGATPATPTGGGVLFVQAGALKYVGSSGTVTTLAPA